MDYQESVQTGAEQMPDHPTPIPEHGGYTMFPARMKIFLATFLFVALAASPVMGQKPRSFAVLPFEVHGPETYKHLSQGIQSMFISRLNREGLFTPVDKSAVGSVGKLSPASTQQAGEIIAALGAEYLIWGSVTIMGKEASLDIQVLEGGQNPWTLSNQTPLDNLIPLIESSAATINARIFPSPETAAAPSPAGKQTKQINPGLVMNETEPGQQFYLNPEFRYGGTSETPGQFRSQSLPFSSLGMIAGDADNDGQVELFILEDRRVRAYAFEQGKLRELDTFELPHTYFCLNINMLDTDRDGYKEIIVTALQDKTPRSFLLNLKDKKFTTVAERIDLYLSVVRTPPDFLPTLIGQKQGWERLLQSPVHEVDRAGGEFRLGRRLALPSEANVFNFNYMPMKEGFKIALADKKDNLRIYSDRGELQFVTMEEFAGSGIGLETDDTMPGLRKSSSNDGNETFYYIPLRLIPVDLNKDGNSELLVNRNISLAGRFFGRYRSFPQGEIHSLAWNGIGLDTVWKTRRLKGTVEDYGMADINNDGLPDLYVLVNTHPGFSGMSNIKSVVVGYTLDLETLSPNIPVDGGIDEVE
jgi:TolB-like protein